MTLTKIHCIKSFHLWTNKLKYKAHLLKKVALGQNGEKWGEITKLTETAQFTGSLQAPHKGLHNLPLKMTGY